MKISCAFLGLNAGGSAVRLLVSGPSVTPPSVLPEDSAVCFLSFPSDPDEDSQRCLVHCLFLYLLSFVFVKRLCDTGKKK